MRAISTDRFVKETAEVIAREARSETEAKDSQALLELLARRRDELGAGNALPNDDQKLSEELHARAATRSRELRGLQNAAGRTVSGRMDTGKPVPGWLWLLWLAALLGVGLVFWWWW